MAEVKHQRMVTVFSREEMVARPLYLWITPLEFEKTDG
jgi:hypothetical protein